MLPLVISSRAGRGSVAGTIALALFALVVSSAAVASAQTTVEHRIAFDAKDLVETATPAGIQLQMAGTDVLQVEGRPMVPRRSMNFVVPRGMLVTGIEVVDERWEILGNKDLAVSEGLATADGEIAREPVDGLARGAVYPAQVAVLGDTQVMRGYSLAGLTVYPVRVAPDGRVERLADMRVRFEMQIDPRSNTTVRREVAWPGRHEADGALVRACVANPQDADRYAPSRGVDPSVARFDFDIEDASLGKVARLVPEPVDYLIVTKSGLEAEFQRLADYRTSEGLRTSVVTLEEVIQVARPGGDVQETLRNYLKTAYAQWGIQYLLLAGDGELLPPRYARSSFYPLGGYTDIPSDLYFASLDGNWNLDADDLYAEPYRDFLNTGDEADMLGELSVGRAPVKNLAQATVFVDKVLAYENPVDPSYVGRALFMSEVLFPQEWNPGTTITLDGATYAEDIVFNSIIGGGNLMQSWRMYENFGPYIGSIEETAAAALDSMDTGRFGLVNHVGHGFYYNMSVGDRNVFVADAVQLQNDNPFFLHALNCSSGAFDFDCLLETFVQDLDGGAVGTIGSSRAAFPSTANIYQQSFYNEIFVSKNVRAGDAQLVARSQQVASTAVEGSHRWTHFGYHLFSDPALRIWRQEPTNPVVTHASSVTLGEASITVQVNAGAGVAGAQVAATRNDGGFVTLATDAGGQAVLDLTGISDREGTFDLVVSGQNLSAYRTTLNVDPKAAAHLRAVLDSIDDDGTGASIGDADGLVDSGERIELAVMLTNNGGTNATGVSVDLVPVNAPGVSIVNGSVVVGNVNAQSQAVASAFVFDVDSTVADGTLLDFELVSTDGVDTWTQPLQLHVLSPEVEVARLRIDDSVLGNGNGVVDAGETVDLYFELINYGEGTANSVTGTLSTGSPNVTLVDDSNTWGAIALRQSDEGAGAFRLTESSVAQENWVDLALQDERGHTWMHRFELRKPSVPPVPHLDTSLGPDRIALRLDAMVQPHMAGYRVYRRDTQGGNFDEITADRVLRTGLILDEGLASLTRYAYRVSAVDSSGIESGLSPIAEASTAPPEQAGGFPLPVTRVLAGAIAVGDMRGDGTKVATFGADWLYAIDGNGSELRDGDEDSQTLGPLAGDPFSPRFTPSGVSMADLDGDGDDELVGANWDTREIWVVDDDGSSLPGWPQQMNGKSWATPTIADLDGDGDFEIIVNNTVSRTYVWHHDGTDFFDGDANPGTVGVFDVRTNESFGRSTPAVYDVDGDGTLEIIFGTVYRDGRDNFLHALRNDATDAPGWPINLGSGGWNVGHVTIGDLEGDGTVEIILHTEDDKFHVVHPDGTYKAGFPIDIVTVAGNRDSKQPAVSMADFDEDGQLEMVVVSVLATNLADLYLLEPDGSTMPGWPQTVPGLSESSPVIGDINGDGSLDVIFGIGGGSDSAPNVLYAFNDDGSAVQGFPITLPGAVRAVPVITDFNNDGDVDIVYAGFDLFLHVWDMPFPYQPYLTPWPTFQSNMRRTGVYREDAATPVLSGTVSARPSVRGVLIESLFSGVVGDFLVDVDRRRGGEDDFARIAEGLVVHGGSLLYVDDTAEGGVTYEYKISSQDGSVVLFTQGIAVPVLRLALEGAVPNPFNPRTEIRFEIPGNAGSQVPVRLALYDVSGRLVRTLHVGPMAPGAHEMTWNGKDDQGRSVSSGTYFARLTGAGQSSSLKMLLVK